MYQSRFVLSRPLVGLGFFIALLTLLLVSCQKEDEWSSSSVEGYDAEFAVPIFESNSTLFEMLDGIGVDPYADITESGLVSVSYLGNVQDLRATELLSQIDDNPLLELPFPLADSVFAVDIGGFTTDISLQRVRLQEGTFTLRATLPSGVGDPVDLVFNMPNLLKDGQPLQIRDTLVNPNEASIERIIDLKGWDLVPTQDSIGYRYTATTIPDGDRILLNSSTSFFRLQNLDVTYAEGALGNQFYDLERDTIPIDLFNKWISGDINFADPRITVYVDNSFGFPIDARTSILNVLTVDGATNPLGESPLDSFSVDFPSFSEVGQTQTTILAATPENSPNLRDIINKGPLSVDYDLDAIINADPNNPFIGFITDSSRFRIQVEVELPIHGTVSGFTTLDTVEANFSSFDDADEAEFKLVGENDSPLDLELQVYLLDQDSIFIDSLLEGPARILDAAGVDEQGFANSTATLETFIPIDSSRLESVKKTHLIVLSTRFSSFDSENGRVIKALPDHEVRIRMGAIIRIKND